MTTLRLGALRWMAMVGLLGLPTPTAAQVPQATTASSSMPLELHVLDQNATPLTGLTVSINGVQTSPMSGGSGGSGGSVGRYLYSVQGPKVVIRVDLPQKGVQPVVVELPLQQGRSVYVELCIDPQTGAIKNVLQKAARALTTRSDGTVRRIGPGRASGTVQTAAAAPANDDCANALPIADGVTAFSTLGATTDGPVHSACQFTGETGNDIWFVYTASCTGTLTVSTCGDVDYDSDLVVYDGTDCGNLLGSLLGCNDDAVGCANFSSEVLVPVVMGGEYLIRVGGYLEGDTGSGNLTLTCDTNGTGITNDECTGAESLACNSSVTFDNSSASTSPTDPAFGCYFGSPSQGFGSLWYTFVPTTTTAFLSTNLSAGGDTELAVYSGICGNLTEIACSEDEGVGLLSELSLTGLTPGETYYVQVASFSAATQGVYTLDLVCEVGTGRCCLPDGSCFEGVTSDECFTTLGGNDWLEAATCASEPCPQPPINDDCADAIAMGPLPETVFVDNTSATTDVMAGSECGVASGPYRNVWYSFTGDGGTMRVTTCLPGTLNPDTKLSVICGSCGEPVCVGGDDDSCTSWGPFASVLDVCTQAGATYYVTVGDFSILTGGGPIELSIIPLGTSCVPSEQCLPTGACCLPMGACSLLTEDDCAAMGGEYQGDGTDCGPGNAVAEGGFEGGPFGGVWTEGSSTFGTPICDVASCGTGGGTPPFEGDFWCWFGGIGGLVEVGFVEQSVVIPPGAGDLTFYLDIPASSGNGADFLEASIDGNVVFSVLEGDPTYTLPGWQQVAIDLAGYRDGAAHTLRLDSTTSGTLPTNFFVDDVRIEVPDDACETCVVVDFEADDDGTPFANGQALSSPPNFGTYFTLGSSGLAQGPAIFDSTPGVNFADDDLWIGKGNVLINQENSGQTVPGIFNVPDDCACGGTFYFDFVMPVELRSLVLADIDDVQPPQDAYVKLIDGSGLTRTYHLPSGFTEKLTVQGGTGWRTVDLTTLAPQPGFAAVGIAVEDPGFASAGVVRMEVVLTSSAAIDDIEFCF